MPVPVEFQRDERVERRRARRRQIRRRRIAATVVLAAVVGMVAASSTGLFGGKKQTGQAAPTATEIQPGLGTTILPTYRVVAVVGAPGQDASLGRGSIGTPNEGVRVASEELAPQYAGDKPVLPAFMLIATLATEASNGGRNSTRLTDAQIETYLTAARNHGAILILDIQPGHSPWMDEVRAYTRWLKEPDVSLAIDPEWNMPPGKNPGEVFGTTSAAEINEISAYMQRISDENKLPQKLLVVHELTPGQLTDQSEIVDRPGVQTVLDVDGVGSADEKVATYVKLTNLTRGKQFPMGFKLFFQDDTKGGAEMMTPDDVMNTLIPQPDLVVYE